MTKATQQTLYFEDIKYLTNTCDISYNIISNGELLMKDHFHTATQDYHTMTIQAFTK